MDPKHFKKWKQNRKNLRKLPTDYPSNYSELFEGWSSVSVETQNMRAIGQFHRCYTGQSEVNFILIYICKI